MNVHRLSLSVGMLALLLAPFVNAAVITPGFTFAVASDCSGGFGASPFGTHFHSNTGGSFGNPAGIAEVGEFGGDSCEEVRGLSEYNLTGLTAGPAFVTFEVFSAGGLFFGDNDFPFDGTISVNAYLGNNTEDISDYEAASIGFVGSVDTTALVDGNSLSLDLGVVYNEAITAGFASLGIRLAASTDPSGGAYSFNNFRLTSTDETTPGIPLPLSLTLLLPGCLLVMRSRPSNKRR